MAKDRSTPKDWCYVENFQDSYRPEALSLKAGKAGTVNALVDHQLRKFSEGLKGFYEGEEKKGKGLRVNPIRFQFPDLEIESSHMP